MNKEPTEKEFVKNTELIKRVWCDGFNVGFAEAQEKISNYIKEMGYAVRIPCAYELFERIKGE